MRARVIIHNPQTDAVLLIHRFKNGREYWVVPGGGAQGVELPVQTAIREITEELQIKFKPSDLKEAFALSEDEVEQQIFFLGQVISSDAPKISGEEAARISESNVYIPTWVNLADLEQLNLQPSQLTARLQQILKIK
ncbi:NUDIX domain-containing protein [Lactobacillus sp. ESL0684]|uniref:NUDIX domain-containing protein n=1 Tax=Lactobacillus sp. ESL0684 TaxID=2983213 RepID=UPI0023F8B4DB|nr:NUDIX domain-containing protein [Lactobacillus sp. ESL0684]WEV44012.1 NUDIX domain-containing protein [Lactobacillus sp. ESL0684]